MIQKHMEAGHHGAKGVLAVQEKYVMYPKHGLCLSCFGD